MKELINEVVESYKGTRELKITANEFNMSPLKVRKMLITAGVYHSEVLDEINELYSQGIWKGKHKPSAELVVLTEFGGEICNIDF